MTELPVEPAELRCMFGRETSGRKYVERRIIERFTVDVKRVAEHMPRTRARERVFVFGRLRPEMIRTQADVLDDERMDTGFRRPGEPVAMRWREMDVDHPVDER